MFFKTHQKAEKNSILLAVLVFIVATIGGIVEIVPLFYIESTVKKVDGMRPYTPLELAGRNIYIREGCYACHSQMIRPFRDEVERYGHYSIAAESMYDHPFQWGSKRTGPDLARVGGRYSNQWHVDHMNDPRAVVPESVMPAYPFLAENELDYTDMNKHLQTQQIVGVPYTEEMVENALDDVIAQQDPDSDYDGLQERYSESAKVANYDGNPQKVTELDAVIAYLQMLGTLVDFESYQPEIN